MNTYLAVRTKTDFVYKNCKDTHNFWKMLMILRKYLNDSNFCQKEHFKL